MPPRKSARVQEVIEEEKKNQGDWKWNQKGTCIYGDSATVASDKIAGFDMDWTLIRTKSGKTFPQHANDWVLWDKMVIKKIQELYNKDYKIVIFSNQGGIGSGKQQAKDIKNKIQNISKEIGVPMQAFLSTQEDVYKKPSPGMWDFMAKDCNNGIKIDLKNSMYVGDAAGRKPPEVTKKDFSDSDMKFAYAVGVQFFTPEALFLGQKQNSKPTGFDPKKFAKNKDLFKEKDAVLKLKEQEMIVFCGSSSSGKSTFTQNHLKDYERVNRDTLKTKEKCLKVAEEALKNKKSVVIDNTNPTSADRAIYIKLAKQYSVPVRCFFFECEKDQCFFLNEQRVINQNRKHLSGKVPKIPIHSFFKNYEHPKVSEGFQSVQTVQFVPITINEADEKSFYVFGK